MKKAALTFGLFSLIMVATSFATPEKTNRSIAGNIEISIGVDGGNGRVSRKGDFVSNASKESYSDASQIKGFALDSQLTKSRVKVD
ncbi:hypothetical protein [Flavobacterium sp. ov086]|uniref:hypothetical protein n=1 Tax=Flavobacterium sp. ov086 TaxID=1761785 RepID=UPI000B637753|nr:hypothetical protein [Flavobacterium sp. ov086]SNS02865.1 hypothetical protein SAMN04487979_1462 [Flavobacterium sp. ov086]